MKYFLRKLGFFVLTLWAVVTLNFIIPRVQPGDPAEIMVQKLAGKSAQLDQAQVQALRDMLGTPQGSLVSQYFQYLGQLLHGNFGLSYTYYPFKVTEVDRVRHSGGPPSWSPSSRCCRSRSVSCSVRSPRGAATGGSTPWSPWCRPFSAA